MKVSPKVTTPIPPKRSKVTTVKLNSGRKTKKVQEGLGKTFPKNSIRKKAYRVKLPYLTPKYRLAAESLLWYMRKTKEISYDRKGQLKYRGKVIPDSNITELLIHAIKPKGNNNLKGLHQFYDGLALLNLPKSIIRNVEGRSFMKNHRNLKDYEWRPPGKLYKK